jgi:hypothetical protein
MPYQEPEGSVQQKRKEVEEEKNIGRDIQV